ncbi:unnamed protein product [Symbiodinium microadriaticum]|nr:unnamed protein product [Symbiodinium sp. KB8]CAE7184236.1 unnamed protein product [Symbiodinium microadriaticum]
MVHRLLLAVVAVEAVRDSDMQLESSEGHWKMHHRAHHHHHHHLHHHKHPDQEAQLETADAQKGAELSQSAFSQTATSAYGHAEPFPVGSLLSARTHHQHRDHHQKADAATTDESDTEACQEEVDIHQPQHLLEALRRCLEARKELSVKTQELLKEEKEGGKVYATEVTGIMDLIKKVQDADRMDGPWNEDHKQVLQQLLEQTGEAEKEAEAVWQEHHDSDAHAHSEPVSGDSGDAHSDS